MRAALYIDCDSIEAKAVPVIYEDIIRTDKLVICKMFNSDKDDDSFVESAGRFRIQDCMHGEYKVSSAMVALAVEVRNQYLRTERSEDLRIRSRIFQIRVQKKNLARKSKVLFLLLFWNDMNCFHTVFVNGNNFKKKMFIFCSFAL